MNDICNLTFNYILFYCVIINANYKKKKHI